MLVLTVLGYKKISLDCTHVKISYKIYYLGYVFLFNH
jgi:hypothetical protein